MRNPTVVLQEAPAIPEQQDYYVSVWRICGKNAQRSSARRQPFQTRLGCGKSN
jgi:hypothetical protein